MIVILVVLLPHRVISSSTQKTPISITHAAATTIATNNHNTHVRLTNYPEIQKSTDAGVEMIHHQSTHWLYHFHRDYYSTWLCCLVTVHPAAVSSNVNAVTCFAFCCRAIVALFLVFYYWIRLIFLLDVFWALCPCVAGCSIAAGWTVLWVVVLFISLSNFIVSQVS